MKLTKGQILYRVKPVRRHELSVRQVEAVTIDTVGSKYFTIAEDPGHRYMKATLREEERCRPALHLTAQEITDEWARADLQNQVGRVFEYHVPVPLATLRQIEILLADQLAVLSKPLPAL